MNNILHTKQFVISNFCVDIDEFEKLQLKNGLYLTYDGVLPFKHGFSKKSSTEFFIIGIAVQTDSKRLSPLEELENEEFSSLRDCISTWSGRYVVCFGDYIYTDAGGLMALFHTHLPDKGIIVTNSLNILHNEFSIDYCDGFVKDKPLKGLFYYPGPKSILKGVSKLMCTQFLKKVGADLEPVFYPVLSAVPKMPDAELAKKVDESLVTFMKNLAKTYSNIYVSLSGGYDSRTVLSIAKKSGINFKAYTCIKNDISYSDSHMPGKICKKLGIDHTYIERANISDEERKERLKLYDAYTCGNSVDRDREYYAYKQLVPKGSIVLGGGCWELSTTSYIKAFNFEHSESAGASELFKNFMTNDLIISMFDEWLNYIRTNPIDEINFVDRTYFEPLISCWLSGVDHSWGLSGSDRLQPLTCAKILSYFVSIRKNGGDGRAVQKEIININEPTLLKYKFNHTPFCVKVIDRLTKR